MSAPENSKSTHLDFPNGTEVFVKKTTSQFFGQKGIVYGSGPAPKNPSSSAVVWIRWPDGTHCGYLPVRLGQVPLAESSYRTRHFKRDGKKISVHEIPATKFGRPTLQEKHQLPA